MLHVFGFLYYSRLGPKVYLIGIIPAVVAFGLFRDVYSLYALILVAAFYCPYFFLRSHSFNKDFLKTKKVRYFDLVVILAALIIGMLNLGVVLRSIGLDLSDISSREGVALASLRLSEARYEISTTSNSGNPILLACQLYIIHSVSVRRGSLLTIAIVTIPLVVYSLITTEKWILYLVLCSIFAGIVVHRNLWSIIKIFILFFPVIGVLFGITLFLRNSSVSIWEGIIEYTLLQYRNLGVWIASDASLLGDFSFTSFIGILDFIGISNRSAGVWLYSNSYRGLESNIFTAHRYWVSDFGLFFPTAINSFIVLVCNRSSSLPRMLLTYLIIYSVLIGINTTLFVHNSVFLAVCLLGVEYFLRYVQIRKVYIQHS
jgi:hypothetical protein